MRFYAVFLFLLFLPYSTVSINSTHKIVQVKHQTLITSLHWTMIDKQKKTKVSLSIIGTFIRSFVCPTKRAQWRSRDHHDPNQCVCLPFFLFLGCGQKTYSTFSHGMLLLILLFRFSYFYDFYPFLIIYSSINQSIR